MNNSKQGCLNSKVLIIEADVGLCGWLSAQLNLVHGVAELRTVAGLAAAEEQLVTWSPDLLVIDICTLSLNSVRSIITQAKNLAVPRRCIVATLYDDSDELLSALRAGADAYVSMDEDDAVFVQQLQDAVLGRSRLSAKLARRLIAEFGLHYRDEISLAKDEISVLELAARGLGVKASADSLEVGYEVIAKTVKTLYKKLHAPQGREAVA
jgi:two-component system nitrate/nitrite response regulator NarL